MSWSSLESSKCCPAAMRSTAALMPEWRLGSTSKAFRYLGAGQRAVRLDQCPQPHPSADCPVACAPYQ